MSNLDAAAAYLYDHGQAPLDWAIKLTEIQIDAAFAVLIGREDDPRAFPGYGDDPTPARLACRIVGHLLEAGWTPPDTEQEPS